MSVAEIRDTRFAAALAKLAVACRQEADDLTLETYTEAMADRVDPDEWEAFVLEANRSRKYTWFPGLQKLGDDFDAWCAARRPKVVQAPREDGQFWASGAQAQHVAETVRQNPKEPSEGVLGYIRRVAILAGLTTPDIGESVKGRMLRVSDPSSNRDVRLPYKEPEEREPGAEG